MKMEQTECSETSAYKIQTPENYPEESIQHSEHGERLKSRKIRWAGPVYEWGYGTKIYNLSYKKNFSTSHCYLIIIRKIKLRENP